MHQAAHNGMSGKSKSSIVLSVSPVSINFISAAEAVPIIRSKSWRCFIANVVPGNAMKRSRAITLNHGYPAIR